MHCHLSLLLWGSWVRCSAETSLGCTRSVTVGLISQRDTCEDFVTIIPSASLCLKFHCLCCLYICIFSTVILIILPVERKFFLSLPYLNRQKNSCGWNCKRKISSLSILSILHYENFPNRNTSHTYLFPLLWEHSRLQILHISSGSKDTFYKSPDVHRHPTINFHLG